MNLFVKLFWVGIVFSYTAIGGVTAQSCQCDKVFARVKQNVENNYAGWFDKVNFDNVKKYHSYSEPFKMATKGIGNDNDCAAKINEWLSYFYDKNLKVTSSPNNQKLAGQAPTQNLVSNETMNSAQAPKLEFEDDLAIVTLPVMGSNTAKLLSMLMDKEKGSLEDAGYWIIDLRNTKGSNDQVLDILLPYIYTRPMVKYHSEIRMTQQNYDLWYDTYAKSAYASLKPEDKRQKEIELDSMKAHFGRGYNPMGKVADTLVFDKVVAKPKKVAVLINAGTEQAAELFTNLAKQSDKVTIMGENSGGNIDYDLLVYPPTYCSQIAFQMPIQRRLWLDAGYSMDKVGIKADVALTGKNWIEEANKMLRKGK